MSNDDPNAEARRKALEELVEQLAQKVEQLRSIVLRNNQALNQVGQS
jgi:flagellar biosynthesis/type III secretory pathway chaperone